MKKAFSLLLALIMVMSLFGVMGVSALADEDNEGSVTILVTGGMSQAGEEGLSYATLAAWKNTYEEDTALLVDAGDFDATAVAVMNAAGYDLAVPGEKLDGAEFACVSMGLEDLSAGAYLTKNGVSIAVIGLVPMGDTAAEEYYAAVQSNVDAAVGADFVVAVGQTEDGQALVENVPGLKAVVLVGDETDESVVSTGEESSALVSTVAADGVIVLKLGADGIEGSHATVEDIAELGLTDDEDVAAVEAAWQEALAAAAEAEADEPEEEPEEEPAEEAGEEDNEEAQEPVEETVEQTQEETLEPAAQEETESQQDAAQEEEDASGTDAVVSPTPAQQESAVSTSDAVLDTDQSSDLPNDDDPANDPADDGDDDDQNDDQNGEQAEDTITFDRGANDKVVELTGASLDKIQIGGEDSTHYLVEGSDYSVSNDGLTVTLFASTLNNWPEAGSTKSATYKFRFIKTDGSVEEKTILIQGEYTAPSETPAATATPEASATPEPTATPAANRGNNPATGDTSPIILYVVILVVLVAALVVVIVLATKSSKKRK
jgi:hypothetical protein